MALWSRIRNLFRGNRHAGDVEDELAFHIDMRTRDNIAAGMSAEQAQQDARVRFGNLTAKKEQTRDAGIVPTLDMLAQDTKYAFRALRSSRAISVLVISALALGIGANTAIFTITHALVMRSLPVKDPAHLQNIQVGNFMSWGYIEISNSFTANLWNEFTRLQDVLTDVFAYAENRFDAVLTGETKQITSAFVTAPMFRTLGLNAIIGRTFEESNAATPQAASQAVISYALWTREFASDPGVIGRTLVIEGKPFTVAGVLPSRFFGLTPGHVVDIYLPLLAEPYIRGPESAFKNPLRYWLQVFGRVRTSINAAQAQERLTALSGLLMRATLPAELPERVRPRYLAQNFTMIPAAAGVSYIRTNLEVPLAVLSGIAALLLVLTCFTVANLLLARGTARQKEIAVRIALGAGRARVIRQLLLEGLLLALAGMCAGIAIARLTAAFLVRYYSVASDPLELDLSTDWGVFGFALGLAVLSATIFGLMPALRVSRINPAESMRGITATAGASVLNVRRMLLAAQLAVSVVLVAAAVLFGATLRNLLTVDTGFQSDRVLLADIDLRRAHVAKSGRKQLYMGILERVKRLPLVESASISNVTPISGSTWQFNAKAETDAGPKDIHIYYYTVSPDFFETFGTAILAGRAFSAMDNASGAQVALVNATLARAAFGTTDVIGRRMSMLDPEPRTVEIIGIVQDAKYRSLRQPIPPTLYALMSQYSTPPAAVSIALRSRGSTAAIVRDVSTILTQEYPDVSFRLASFRAQISDSIARDRAFAFLCGLFAALALSLAAIGIYGVLSYFIARRQAEIGIRIALGATPAAVRRMVYRQSFLTCAAGLCAGSLLAFWGGRYTKALLYGVTPADAYVYAAAVAVIAAVAVVATGVPAFRASRTDSLRVLRCE